MSAAQWHENNNEACRSDATPAQVTEAHKQLVATIVEQAFRFAEGNHKITPLSQLIADSEAKAVAEWQDFVHLQGEAIDSLLMECNRLHAENSDLRAKACQCSYDEACAHVRRAERAEAEVERLRAGIGECLRTNAHLADGEDCTLIGLKRCLRDPAAIDAAIKEGA